MLHTDQVSIITCAFIINQGMTHVQQVAFLVYLQNTHLQQTNPGIQVYHNIKNQAINMSKIEHTDQCQVILKNIASFISHIRQHPVKRLKKVIGSYQTESVSTWLYWCKLVNMVTLIQQILPQWDIMLSNSCHNNTYYKKTQLARKKSLQLFEYLSKLST